MKILRYTADWCIPCKQLSKTIEIAELKIPVEIIDIDKNREAAKSMNIRNIPTLILLDDNYVEVKRISGGGLTVKQLNEWIG